jgi:hypothetical protein
VSLAGEAPAARGPALLRRQIAGVALFLFIPLVLFLFVRHPAPIGASLVAGVALIAIHRPLGRAYMRGALAEKCLWCNGAPRPSREPFPLATGDGEVVASVCARHREPAARFVTFLDRARVPLRIGIFVPLLLLLVALAAAAFGAGRWLPTAVAVFQLAVGITVNVAALGYLAVRSPRSPARVPFPAHNFFLLGIRNLLWIFRAVGIWWIIVGVKFFLERA